MRLGWSWEVDLYVVVVVDVDVARIRLSPPSSRGNFADCCFSYIVDLVSSRIPDAIGVVAALVVVNAIASYHLIAQHLNTTHSH